MLLTARPGEFAARLSSCVNVTFAGVASFALCETNTRPVVVAAHSVLASDAVRCSQLTFPPARAAPRPVPVRERPSRDTQSPQVVPEVKVPVNSLQFESRYACDPPLSSVRQTWLSPAYIVPCTVGSVMIGK